MADIAALEDQLNDFSLSARQEALEQLVTTMEQGEVDISPSSRAFNLHGHTFFSYNAYGYSPSRFAWEAKKAGLWMVGTVDFDVLDAMDEIYSSADVLGLPASAGLETRVFVEEYASLEICSPGEPGIAYFMGIGFIRPPQTDAGRSTLQRMFDQAHNRNRVMLAKLNKYFGLFHIDYEQDVVPLTPSGNATERHMLEAIEAGSDSALVDTDKKCAFWSDKLAMTREQVAALLAESNRFRDTVRSKLMKRGGIGYAPPGRDTFLAIEEVIAMILSAGAIPTMTWLDGASAGESDPGALIDCLLAKGCEALNIIPDRNWNITDAAEKKIKLAKLEEVVAACRQRHLPVIVGTEMNKAGQKLVDLFAAPELVNVIGDFYAGAEFLYGHTLMERALSHGCVSDWAKSNFSNRRQAVEFYRRLGREAGPPARAVEKLQALHFSHPPGAALAAL